MFKKLFILLLLIPNVAFANSSPVVITKIAAFEKSGYEWVEICNRSDSAVDTNGWKFFEDGKNHGWGELKDDNDKLVKDDEGNNAHREDLVLEAGERAFIVQDEDKFLEIHGDWTGTIIDSAWSSLKESGEEIGIKDAEGELIELFTYIACPDNVLERIDANVDDYSGNNWLEKQISAKEERIDAEEGQIGRSDQSDENGGDGGQGGEDGVNVYPDSSAIHKNLLNNPPVAIMGDDLEINVGDTVFFDASDSFDKDGDALEYFWDFGDGKEGEGVKIEHTYLHAGKMSAILRVSDGEFVSSSAIWINSVAIDYPDKIFINAFLPNPIGPDAEEEWIEVCNVGKEDVNLFGWILDDIADGGSKEFVIKNVNIFSQECVRFTRPETKIAINNNGDDVRLLNPAGEIVDQISFSRNAGNGEIFYGNQNMLTDSVVVNNKTKTQILKDEDDSDEIQTARYETQVKSIARDVVENLPLAARTGDIFGEDLDGEKVKISGNITDKSGNVFFVDDGSGEARIQILPKIKIQYADVAVGDQITVDGKVSKTQIGYRILPDLIEKK